MSLGTKMLKNRVLTNLEIFSRVACQIRFLTGFGRLGRDFSDTESKLTESCHMNSCLVKLHFLALSEIVCGR